MNTYDSRRISHILLFFSSLSLGAVVFLCNLLQRPPTGRRDLNGKFVATDPQEQVYQVRESKRHKKKSNFPFQSKSIHRYFLSLYSMMKQSASTRPLYTDLNKNNVYSNLVSIYKLKDYYFIKKGDFDIVKSNVIIFILGHFFYAYGLYLIVSQRLIQTWLYCKLNDDIFFFTFSFFIYFFLGIHRWTIILHHWHVSWCRCTSIMESP